MVMKVLHNILTCAVVIYLDMYALALGPVALGFVHTYQANHSCPCYIYNISLHSIREARWTRASPDNMQLCTWPLDAQLNHCIRVYIVSGLHI